MIGLQIRFLAGRCHATGWKHAHNEGIPEWPPSPWRILRALVSASYTSGLNPNDVCPLLEKLRGLPKYILPLATLAHTRHYIPELSERKPKVFDAFAVIEGGSLDPKPLTVVWDSDLTHDEMELLKRLCDCISYLGRAESWAELLPINEVDRDCNWDCWPCEYDTKLNGTTLMALTSAEDLEKWVKTQPISQKVPKVPTTLWDVLTFDTKRYKLDGWTSLPGTRLVRYVFKKPPFIQNAQSYSFCSSSTFSPTVARFAIRSAVLPHIYEAVSIGERLRIAAMSHSRRISGDVRPVFSGHGDIGPGHQHAMYLSTTEDPTHRARGLIDHVLINARSGFKEEDIIALQSLKRLWGHGGHDLELILTGLGKPDDYGGIHGPKLPILAKSKVWESVTPFVPTRHTKTTRGIKIDTIEDQLIRGCEQFLGVKPISVSPIGNSEAWSRFRRRRFNGGGSRGMDRAFGVRLVFKDSVEGPIALGYGAHFGLGLFEARGE